MVDTHRIEASGISAVVTAEGAELTSVRDGAGTELLWQAGPEWPRHAPVLFPIVGRLAGDVLRHAGRDYTLTQHGFARDSRFEWVERSPSRAVLRLSDSAATRERYPFAFRLDLIYEVAERSLAVTSRITNTGDDVLPCGVGAHPGFRWPLVDDCPKDRHELRFEAEEEGPVLSVEGGLLGAPKPDMPIEGRVLPLREELFARDALVLPGVKSRSVRYVALGEDGAERRALTISWDDYKDLGVWSKPSGAPFLCIEPWYSMASPVGWDGEIAEKPGFLRLSPGDSRDFVWRVAV
ncbi:aldose 1-epimerase [Aureimonas endophytica]|uniref:Aldose 1-epimerase n=1 Tax=Aureimonas endophytica TaxID=2027858 RepID=A0A916ZJS4_9HYPH|nr:aldose 1-epimerase family protein [Aureimonas endophytica]GGE00154.1 aldose 1-epimerase [Aureimonas endophytica]